MPITLDTVLWSISISVDVDTYLPLAIVYTIALEDGGRGETRVIRWDVEGHFDESRSHEHAEADLVILQQMYAREERFSISEIGHAFNTKGWDLTQLSHYGSFNPFVPEEYEDYKNRLASQGAGSPSTGVSVDFDDLESVDGIKQVSVQKWVDTIHYHGTTNQSIQFSSPDDYIYREGTHRNTFLHNASHNAELKILDHLGEVVEILPAEHSCDIRVTREKPPGTSSLIVIRPAAHHLDFTDSRSAERRWHEVVNWAKRNSNDVANHPENDPKNHIDAIKRMYDAYIYNVVLVAHNRENRASDLKWATVESNLIDWQEFSRNADGSAMSSRIAADNALSSVYSLDNVWGMNADRDNIKRIVLTDLDAVPLSGLGNSLMDVRSVLGHVQDAGISEAKLESVTAVQFDESIATAVIANPTTYNLAVSSTTINPTITVNPTYEYASVVLTAPDTLNADGSLPTGVHAYSVVITSQDGTETAEYTLNVTRGA